MSRNAAGRSALGWNDYRRGRRRSVQNSEPAPTANRSAALGSGTALTGCATSGWEEMLRRAPSRDALDLPARTGAAVSNTNAVHRQAALNRRTIHVPPGAFYSRRYVVFWHFKKFFISKAEK